MTHPRSDQTASAGCVQRACLGRYSGGEIGVQTRSVEAKPHVVEKAWHVSMIALEVVHGKWHHYQCA